MPLYDYKCSNCGWTNEESRPVEDRKLTLTTCRKCEGTMVPQVPLIAHTPNKWNGDGRL